MNQRNTHLIAKNTPDGRYEFHCTICQKSYIPELPINTDTLSLRLEEWEKKHAHDNDTCQWQYDGCDDLWLADCGITWQISNYDSPSENNMNYCPGCGRSLAEVIGADEEE